MYNYCTLFDSNYLTRGLAMYESLKLHSSDFHLYIFAFDDKSKTLLKKLDLEYCTIVGLNEFENEKLLEAKQSRTKGEYCWTCTPSIIKYAIDIYQLDSCTYLDADLYFFSNPDILIDEMDGESVLITEHRYTRKYDQTESSGKYCVQFMTFKNNYYGIKVLDWWMKACINWCYARHEDGKFGDQKYLDDWVDRFNGVYELKNLGGGVAPWNVQQYELNSNNGKLFGKETNSTLEFPLVFYHFHNFKYLENDQVDLGGYQFKKTDLDFLYKPYIQHIEAINNFLGKIDKTTDYNGVIKKHPFHWKDPVRFLKRKARHEWNFFDKEYFLGDN